MKLIINMCALLLIVLVSVNTVFAQDAEDLSQQAANPIANLMSFYKTRLMRLGQELGVYGHRDFIKNPTNDSRPLLHWTSRSGVSGMACAG